MLPYSSSKHLSSPLLYDNGKKQYQQLIRYLVYLMHCSRPDLAYPVIRVLQFASATQQHHWEDIKRVLRYLQGTTGAQLILGNTDSNNCLVR